MIIQTMIDNAIFSRVRNGYDTAQVDEYLDWVIELIENGEPIPDASFKTSKWGYNQVEVNILIKRVKEAYHAKR